MPRLLVFTSALIMSIVENRAWVGAERSFQLVENFLDPSHRKWDWIYWELIAIGCALALHVRDWVVQSLGLVNEDKPHPPVQEHCPCLHRVVPLVTKRKQFRKILLFRRGHFTGWPTFDPRPHFGVATLDPGRLRQCNAILSCKNEVATWNKVAQYYKNG